MNSFRYVHRYEDKRMQFRTKWKYRILICGQFQVHLLGGKCYLDIMK